MKKAFSVLLSAVLVLSLGACNLFSNNNVSSETESSSLPSEVVSSSQVPSPGIDVDDDKITITLPAYLFENGYDLDLADVSSEDIAKNEDGSYTVVLEKTKYLQLVQEYKGEIDAMFEQFSQYFSSIQSIDSNDSLTEITIVASQSEFEKGLDSVALVGLSMGALTYQAFTETPQDEDSVTIYVKDAQSGEIFLTRSYPEAYATNS